MPEPTKKGRSPDCKLPSCKKKSTKKQNKSVLHLLLCWLKPKYWWKSNFFKRVRTWDANWEFISINTSLIEGTETVASHCRGIHHFAACLPACTQESSKWLWQWYCITDACMFLPSLVQEMTQGLWMDSVVAHRMAPTGERHDDGERCRNVVECSQPETSNPLGKDDAIWMMRSRTRINRLNAFLMTCVAKQKMAYFVLRDRAPSKSISNQPQHHKPPFVPPSCWTRLSQQNLSHLYHHVHQQTAWVCHQMMVLRLGLFISKLSPGLMSTQKCSYRKMLCTV